MAAGSLDRAAFYFTSLVMSDEIRVDASILELRQRDTLYEKRIMRYLMWFLRIALFLVLLGFTVKNAETVTVHYYFGYEWQAPLILIILLSFCHRSGHWVMDRALAKYSARSAKSRYRQKKVSVAGGRWMIFGFDLSGRLFSA